MRIVFRADASVDIGTGHIMRNLALAERLRKQGAEVRFLCRTLPGGLSEFIAERHGFAAQAVDYPGPDADWEADRDASLRALAAAGGRPDWIIVDHYGLDARWESALRPACGSLMAIDDLADRPHACDLLLDQNLYADPDSRYAGRAPDGCRLLIGPAYALLREDFPAARARRRARDGSLRRLLVFFGGSDPGDETSKALGAVRILAKAFPGLETDVIVGASNPHRDQVEARCADTPGTRFHCQVGNMADLMARADLAIGAGGTATWERCCVGLPAIAAILAENQRELLENAHRHGVLASLGWSDRLTAEDYARAASGLGPSSLRQMETRCLELVDGRGSERVADALSAGKGG